MKSIFHALNRLKVFRGLTEQEFAWVLYDVGNSAFTMLSCSLIPIWFKSLAIGTAPGQINSHQATAYYSIAVAVVTVIVALLGPIFGVLADHKDKKKVLFTTAAALGIFGCNFKRLHHRLAAVPHHFCVHEDLLQRVADHL